MLRQDSIHSSGSLITHLWQYVAISVYDYGDGPHRAQLRVLIEMQCGSRKREILGKYSSDVAFVGDSVESPDIAYRLVDIPHLRSRGASYRLSLVMISTTLLCAHVHLISDKSRVEAHVVAGRLVPALGRSSGLTNLLQVFHLFW